MKRNSLLSVALGIVITMMGACNSDVWDDIPQAISQFVSEYFPFGELESYTENNGSAVVQIKRGATLTFNRDYEWIDVNGNGVVLPQQFLYDKLPATLYNYLEQLEAQNSVYRVERTPSLIKVTLFDSVLNYDQETGKIRYAGM